MLNSSILKSAMALICEALPNTPPDDYSERTPYILANFCNQCSRVNQKYITAHELEYLEYTERAVVDIDQTFPLVPALVPAATYYLAAMLVIDENEALSDKLFDLYAAEASSIAAEADAILNAPEPEPKPDPEPESEPPIPAVLETIVNKY